MNEVAKFEVYKEKLQGICDENNLVYSFKKDKYPIILTIRPTGGIEEQITMLENAEEDGYLDGGMTQEVDLLARLKTAEAEGRTRNIECKYFKVDLFKKGTTHIKFTNMELVEKFNIYAARNKNWLPPNYGKAQYSDMSAEGQAVVADFQGEAAYAEVMAKRAYYLAEPTREVPALMPAT